jgi:mRNA interferase MazF
MPITFVPHPGTVLICDYRTGFVPPEMVKRRPVVVVGLTSGRRNGPYVVVPLSTNAPHVVEPFTVRIPAGRYPFFWSSRDIWAKCDMLAAVASHRLDRLRADGKWSAPIVERSDFRAIQRGVLHALGLSALTRWL